jgi:sulfur-oxidizing protein SoxX
VKARRLLVLVWMGLGAAGALAQVASFTVRGDGIEAPLAAPGDARRGLAIASSRQQGLCLLCHSAPVEERFQGNLAPPLAGVAGRLSQAQLRLRLVDSRRVQPDSTMPPFHSTEGLSRVGAAWQGKPVLDAQQLEDVLAWLLTLK